MSQIIIFFFIQIFSLGGLQKYIKVIDQYFNHIEFFLFFLKFEIFNYVAWVHVKFNEGRLILVFK